MMTMYTTVDVQNDDHVYNSRHAQRLLMYTWLSLRTSTVVYMVIVVNVYCCIHGHRCERLLLYTWSMYTTVDVHHDDHVYNNRRSQR
jgi:hypothetical protein